MTAIAAEARARTGAGSFYVWMSAAFVAVAFLGFIPTYWTPLAAGQFKANPVVHLHGVFFFGWTIFALVQAGLVPRGRSRCTARSAWSASRSPPCW